MNMNVAEAAPRVWVWRNQRTYGPYPVDTLRDMHAKGMLDAADTYRTSEQSPWVSLSELRGVLPPMAAKPDLPAHPQGSPVGSGSDHQQPRVQEPTAGAGSHHPSDASSAPSIYQSVRRETDAIMETLDQPAQNKELAEAVATARKHFRQLKDAADADLLALDKSAEWDAFTIAFYGQTNAGKSTIIETLRIGMGEKTKLAQQRKFQETLSRYGIDTDAIGAWNQHKGQIAKYEGDIQAGEDRQADVMQGRQAIDEAIGARIAQLMAFIAALPFWRRWLAFVWKIPQRTELAATCQERDAASAETRRLEERHQAACALVRGKIASLKESMARMDAAMAELKACEDGTIIGNGLSDFTRDSTRYEFEASGTKIVLLDVPGIEGNEAIVKAPIMDAVRKAHAVFYVTRDASPPQKGDEKSGVKGTLEKIKEHLGAQTEVWTIFNKPLKAPELLLKPIVSPNDQKGLANLEKEMRTTLDGHYAGLLSVSAYPAFVTSTSNFIPGDSKEKDRGKFLKVLGASEIHHKTGFQDLIAKLSQDMAANSRAKIRRSNFNKAHETVVGLHQGLAELEHKRFAPLYGKLERESHASIRQLESATAALKSRLESDAMDLLGKIRTETLQGIYKEIEDNISNDAFKRALEDRLKQARQDLESRLPPLVDKNIQAFKQQVQSIAEQFQEHAREFLDDASKAGLTEFNLSIDIDNGINVTGLVMSVLGAVGLMFASGGVLLVIGVIGVVVAALKAVAGFFSPGYKRAQQKKAANENIDKFIDAVRGDYTKQLQESFAKLDSKMSLLKTGFRAPAQQVQKIRSLLADSSHRLGVISQDIKTRGGL